MMLSGLLGMVGSIQVMAVGNLRMMPSLLVRSLFMLSCGFLVMLGRMFVMFSRLLQPPSYDARLLHDSALIEPLKEIVNCRTSWSSFFYAMH
jgi:hypothetical protein